MSKKLRKDDPVTIETSVQDPVQAAVDAAVPPGTDSGSIAVVLSEAGLPPVGARHYLTRDDILQADDLKREDVWCPEWDGWVIIRSMTGSERETWDDLLIANRDEMAEGAEPVADTQNFAARLVALTAITPDGARMFMPDDRRFLGEKNAVPVMRCYVVALRLSKLRKADVDQATAELGKGANGSSDTA